MYPARLGVWAVRRWGDDVQVVGLCPRPRSSALWCQDGFVNQEGGAFPLPGHPRWPLSQGFVPVRPVAGLSRSSATRLTDNYLGGTSTHW